MSDLRARDDIREIYFPPKCSIESSGLPSTPTTPCSGLHLFPMTAVDLFRSEAEVLPVVGVRTAKRFSTRTPDPLLLLPSPLKLSLILLLPKVSI